MVRGTPRVAPHLCCAARMARDEPFLARERGKEYHARRQAPVTGPLLYPGEVRTMSQQRSGHALTRRQLVKKTGLVLGVLVPADLKNAVVNAASTKLPLLTDATLTAMFAQNPGLLSCSVRRSGFYAGRLLNEYACFSLWTLGTTRSYGDLAAVGRDRSRVARTTDDTDAAATTTNGASSTCPVPRRHSPRGQHAHGGGGRRFFNTRNAAPPSSKLQVCTYSDSISAGTQRRIAMLAVLVAEQDSSKRGCDCGRRRYARRFS